SRRDGRAQPGVRGPIRPHLHSARRRARWRGDARHPAAPARQRPCRRADRGGRTTTPDLDGEAAQDAVLSRGGHMTELSTNSWGKSQVRLSKIHRGVDSDDFSEVTVSVALTGEVADAYLAADNAGVVP